MISPGLAWDQEGDQGYSRASVPFALLQRNSQCVHNGVLMFLFRSDGSTSDVRYQITQESCMYFKVDMWGQLRFEKSTVALSSETDRSILKARFDLELANRFPTKSLLNDLPRDFPGVDPTVEMYDLSCLVLWLFCLVFVTAHAPPPTRNVSYRSVFAGPALRIGDTSYPDNPLTPKGVWVRGPGPALEHLRRDCRWRAVHHALPHTVRRISPLLLHGSAFLQHSKVFLCGFGDDGGGAEVRCARV